LHTLNVVCGVRYAFGIILFELFVDQNDHALKTILASPQ